MIRIAILGSTRGTGLQPIIDAIANGNLAAEIVLVISNKPDALILERARTHHIKAYYFDPKNLSRSVYDEKITQCCQENKIDLIVLIGYMRILSREFVTQWKNKIMNVHPSLLPAHAGKMDLAVHQAVLDGDDAETGCTVHYVTDEVDAGPIILQRHCSVNIDDTAATLKVRVQVLEAQAMIDAIKMHALRAGFLKRNHLC